MYHAAIHMYTHTSDSLPYGNSFTISLYTIITTYLLLVVRCIFKRPPELVFFKDQIKY